MAVKQKFTADVTDLTNKYNQIQKEQDALYKKMNQIGQATKKAEQSQSKFGAVGEQVSRKVVGSVKSMVTSYFGVEKAIQAVIAAQKQMEENSKAAFNTNLSLAQSQMKVIKNIGDVSREEKQAFITRIESIRDDVGFDSARSLNIAAASVLSATGGDMQRTLGIVDASARLMGDAPEEIASFGGAMGDIMKKTGLQDTRRVAGLMLAIQGQARFESLQGFKNVAPALAAVQKDNQGMDQVLAARQGAALFAGIGGEIGDVEGNITKTAVANLSANLRNVVGGDLSLFERIEAVRNNPELRQEVLRSGFKGSVKSTIEELLTGSGGQTGTAVTSAFGKITDSAGLYDRTVSDLVELTSQTQLKARSDRASANIEAFESGPGKARLAEVRQILQSTLEKTTRGPLDWVDNQAFTLQHDYANAGDVGSAIGFLARRRNEYQRYHGYSDYNEMPQQQKEFVDFINAQIQVLREIQSELKSQRSANIAAQRNVHNERD